MGTPLGTLVRPHTNNPYEGGESYKIYNPIP